MSVIRCLFLALYSQIIVSLFYNHEHFQSVFWGLVFPHLFGFCSHVENFILAQILLNVGVMLVDSFGKVGFAIFTSYKVVIITLGRLSNCLHGG